MTFEINPNFQTPEVVANLMAQMIPRPSTEYREHVLEPTPGKLNLVRALHAHGVYVHYPTGDFWESEQNRVTKPYDYVVMNPPFNPVKEMERFVQRACELSDNVIALLPWTYVINSERRMSELSAYGLVSITHLPRKTFPGCRVQVAIFELKKGYNGKTELKRFSW